MNFLTGIIADYYVRTQPQSLFYWRYFSHAPSPTVGLSRHDDSAGYHDLIVGLDWLTSIIFSNPYIQGIAERLLPALSGGLSIGFGILAA